MQDHKQPIECKCPCHLSMGMFHIKPCCKGQCNFCLKHFKSYLIQHKVECKKVTNKEKDNL